MVKLQGAATKQTAPRRRNPKGARGLRAISALLVVDDGPGIDSSSRLDLASQAPCARHLVVSPRIATMKYRLL